VAGVPDGLERLWTPHRLAYISGETVPAAAKADTATQEGCPFCRAQRGSDEDGLVIARGGSVFALLNLYPYNPGHLMVLPYRHVADYPDLSPAETVELAEFSQTAMRVVRRVSSPDGFNLGMNQGATAGAGIAAHLHQHVVPRWSGDTNFMPLIARTKTVPQLLGDTRRLLAEAWPAMASSPVEPAAPPARTVRARPARAPVPAATSPTPATARSAASTSAAPKSATAKSAAPRSATAKSAAAKSAAAKSASAGSAVSKPATRRTSAPKPVSASSVPADGAATRSTRAKARQ
jgi:ATP adenylyltransferase